MIQLNKQHNIHASSIVFALSIVSYLYFHFFTSPNVYFSKIQISPGHIAYFIMLLLPFYVLKSKPFLLIWIFFTTFSILSIPDLLYLSNHKMAIDYSPINGITISVILLLYSYVLVLTLISKQFNLKISKNDFLVLFVSILFAILIFHGFNYIYRNIPNSDRSLFVYGMEFHHINFGIMLLPLVPPLMYFNKCSQCVTRYILLFIIGFIYGIVIDEAYYYTLINMSDKAYFEIDTLIAAIAGAFMVPLAWILYIMTSGKHKNRGKQ